MMDEIASNSSHFFHLFTISVRIGSLVTYFNIDFTLLPGCLPGKEIFTNRLALENPRKNPRISLRVFSWLFSSSLPKFLQFFSCVLQIQARHSSVWASKWEVRNLREEFVISEMVFSRPWQCRTSPCLLVFLLRLLCLREEDCWHRKWDRPDLQLLGD